MRTPRSLWLVVMWMLAVGIGLAANDNWPQFRGAGSLGVAEDPEPSRPVEHDRERGVGSRGPRSGMELAGGLGRYYRRDLGR